MSGTKVRLMTLALVLGLSIGLIGYSAVGVKHQFGKRQFSDLEFNHMSHSGDVARADDGKLVYVPDQTDEAEAAPVVAPQPVKSEEPGNGTQVAAVCPIPQKSKAPAVTKVAAKNTAAKKPAVTIPVAPKKVTSKTVAPVKPAGKPAKGKKKPACPT